MTGGSFQFLSGQGRQGPPDETRYRYRECHVVSCPAFLSGRCGCSALPAHGCSILHTRSLPSHLLESTYVSERCMSVVSNPKIQSEQHLRLRAIGYSHRQQAWAGCRVCLPGVFFCCGLPELQMQPSRLGQCFQSPAPQQYHDTSCSPSNVARDRPTEQLLRRHGLDRGAFSAF